MFSNLKKLNQIFKIFCILAILFFATTATLTIKTQTAWACTTDAECPSGQVCYERTCTPSHEVAAKKAGLKTENGISARIGAVITAVISFVGVIFLILVVAGGLMWMTAGGNEERITKAKKLITNAVIGVIITMLAYAITYFVMEKVAG